MVTSPNLDCVARSRRSLGVFHSHGAGHPSRDAVFLECALFLRAAHKAARRSKARRKKEKQFRFRIPTHSLIMFSASPDRAKQLRPQVRVVTVLIDLPFNSAIPEIDTRFSRYAEPKAMMMLQIFGSMAASFYRSISYTLFPPAALRGVAFSVISHGPPGRALHGCSITTSEYRGAANPASPQRHHGTR